MRKNCKNTHVARIRAQNKPVCVNVSQKREDALNDLFYAINDKNLNYLGYAKACRRYIETVETENGTHKWKK
jgi:hypothetical protein